MKFNIIFPLLLTRGLAAPFELLSKRPLGPRDWTVSKRTGCPLALTPGEFASPDYITQISASQPDKSYGPQRTGVFTPNDISTIFSFDIPASRADSNCTLEFLFPARNQIRTSNYTYSGAGTFKFTGYEASDCPGPQTTYNDQPALGPYGTFPPVHMEPGYAYVIDVGPCSASAGKCVAGGESTILSCSARSRMRLGTRDANNLIVTSTSDTNFSFFQDSGDGTESDCPIGLYTTFSEA